MAYEAIDAYGVIGDLRTAALVGPTASIDWLCLPRFDSPSLFGALLDDRIGGRFELAPELEGAKTRQLYLPDTNVLVTRFVTAEAIVEVTDFMPVSRARHRKAVRPALVRIARVELGSVLMRVRCRPAFDHARSPHRVSFDEHGAVFESAGGERLRLASTTPLQGEDGAAVAYVRLGAGESSGGRPPSIVLALDWGGDPEWPRRQVTLEEADDLLADTLEFWREWVSRCTYEGAWREQVRRSALCLKLLTYEPTGAIVAAPTCSLPEHPGGERNWDYRYTWLRDAGLTIHALLRIGFTEEATAFFGWLEQRCHELEPGRSLRPVYRVDGSPDLPEQVLGHLEGWRGSRPVRIGNAAGDQLQLDVFGTLLHAAWLHEEHASPLSNTLWCELREMLDGLCDSWDRPDNGPWEVRGQLQAFTYSRALCWTALDRGLRLAHARGRPADVARWRATRDAIHEQVMTRGFSKRLGAFTQALDGEALDASCLGLPVVSFIAPGDPRMVSTLRAIDRPLSAGGLLSDVRVHRYDPVTTDDGFDQPEGAFNLLTFWLVEALARAGRDAPPLLERARSLFDHMLAQSTPLGLWAEQSSLRGEALGNYPQALTHLSFISAACELDCVLRTHCPRPAHRERRR